MEDLIKYISAKRLMERWNLEPLELKQLPIRGYIEKYIGSYWIDQGIEDHIFEMVEVHINSFDPDTLLRCQFKLSDVYALEENHRELFGEEQAQLSGKESQELGRLKREKSKWDESIEASVQIGLYCKEQSEKGSKITRDMLVDKIVELGFGDLPNTTIEKIWKAIPEKYRKQVGRPRKK